MAFYISACQPFYHATHPAGVRRMPAGAVGETSSSGYLFFVYEYLDELEVGDHHVLIHQRGLELPLRVAQHAFPEAWQGISN